MVRFELKDEDAAFANQLLPNTPENKLAAGLGYEQTRWDAGFSFRCVDTFRWVVGPFQGNVEAYTVVDLYGNYRFNDTIELGVNVANLFDNDHYEAFGGDLLGSRALANLTFRW